MKPQVLDAAGFVIHSVLWTLKRDNLQLIIIQNYFKTFNVLNKDAI